MLWVRCGRQCSELHSDVGTVSQRCPFAMSASTWARAGTPRYPQSRGTGMSAVSFLGLVPGRLLLPVLFSGFPSSFLPMVLRLAATGIVCVRPSRGHSGIQSVPPSVTAALLFKNLYKGLEALNRRFWKAENWISLVLASPEPSTASQCVPLVEGNPQEALTRARSRALAHLKLSSSGCI